MTGHSDLLRLVLSINLLFLCSSEFMEGDFTTEYATYVIDANLEKFAARTLIGCALACLKTITCQYAAFDKTKKACMVAYDNSYGASTHVPGWILIKMSGLISCADCVRFGSSLYKFVDIPLVMSEAKTNCEILGGKLVEVETEDENKFLKNKIKSLNTHNSVWIGAYRSTPDSSFKRFSEPTEPLIFKDFYPGEPNNRATELCLAFYQPYGYLWVDLPCSWLMAYVCESSL